MIMKYIKKFQNHALYEKYNLNKQNTPNISKCILQNEIHYNSRLPYDAEIEYLEGTGTQYIDTGIVCEGDSEVELKFLPNRYNTVYGVFGAGHYGNSRFAGYQIPNSKFGFQISYKNTYYEVTSSRTDSGYTLILCDGFLFINSVQVLSFNVSTFVCLDTFLLFSSHTDEDGHTVESRMFNGKIFYCKLWNNNVLVRDLIPVRIGTTGYLYDKVSGHLLGNAGTGDFILGPDKYK